MSGIQFIETLKQIGYPKAKSLDPKGFDWMFENQEVFPFLEWFCNNISTSNIISSDEFEEFLSLKNSEDGVIYGEQLEDAVKALATSEEEDVTENELRQSIEHLKMDLKTLKKRKQTLIRRRNKLSVHHTALTHRLSKMGSVEGRVKSQYKKRFAQTQIDSTEMNNCLEALLGSVSQITELYGNDPKSTNNTFLSQIPLEEYVNAEEKYSQELTHFTKKQFFEGISDMANGFEGTCYEILEVSNPETLVIRGESEDVNMKECRELARLQALYPKGETERILLKARGVYISQCLQFMNGILKSLLSGNFNENIDKYLESASDKQTLLLKVRRDLATMEETSLPELIEASTASQASRVLTGDYNLKLARQDYFTSKQDQVISFLVDQRSRNEFLTMAYESEGQSHRDLHRLLTAIQQQLQTHLQSIQSRMAMMSEPAFLPTRHQRGTVDSRNMFVTRLHQSIVSPKEEDSKQLFLTFSSLEEGSHEMAEKDTALKQNVRCLHQRQEENLKALEKSLKTCQEKVYSGSSTTTGQPGLISRPLMDAMQRLEEIINKLQATIKDSVKQIENKKQMLRKDDLMLKERQIFPLFFTNHEQLSKQFDDLSAQLNAERVQ